MDKQNSLHKLPHGEQKKLAEELGLSKAALSKRKKRGKPIDTPASGLRILPMPVEEIKRRAVEAGINPQTALTRLYSGKHSDKTVEEVLRLPVRQKDQSMAEIARANGIDPHTLYSRRSRGKTAAEATTTPTRSYHLLINYNEKIIRLISEHQAQYGKPPSSSWLAERLDLNRATIHNHLQRMARAGNLVERDHKYWVE
jgi:DNA-binding CsgD family transcriptional regulator